MSFHCTVEFDVLVGRPIEIFLHDLSATRVAPVSIYGAWPQQRICYDLFGCPVKWALYDTFHPASEVY